MNSYDFLKVAVASPKIVVADTKHNTDEILNLMNQAKEESVSLLAFPELCITGYTCGDLFFQKELLNQALISLAQIKERSQYMDLFIAVGMPLEINNALYNVLVMILNGHILGVIPKTYLPNYNEFYEGRWFQSAITLNQTTLDLFDEAVPVGTNLLFCHEAFNQLIIGAEVCEDLWAPIPPSTFLALDGATVIMNGSASNDLIGKHQYREQIISTQSAKTISAYLYASCGFGESSTDVVFSGQCLIYENGSKLAENQRFTLESNLTITDIDLGKLVHDRMRMTTYGNSSHQVGDKSFRRIYFNMTIKDAVLCRPINPHPFVPNIKSERDIRCEEIFAIQRNALAKRLNHIGSPKAIIGISGGLDSTLALLVTVKTFDLLDRDRKEIVGVTMPGFGTTDRTYSNAILLMKHLGITMMEISIEEACALHFKDIGHDINNHDLTYENTQARERTQILMDLCSKLGGIVIGTGDLSELALGWATYNGDHMSMYGVNASIPKTLVRYLVEWVASTSLGIEAKEVLMDILDTPVSPELLPPDVEGMIAQKTEEVVGPYELHDFFLYHMLRFGYAPKKILYMATIAFEENYPQEIIIKWLKVFYKRFFSQQFKRSCIPDSPKVGSINLSPRGDLRMPSDASARIWLDNLEELGNL